MENLVIYDDNELRIEVAGWFNYYLNNIYVPTIKLEDKHFKALFPFVTTRLSKYDSRSYQIAYWGKAPIFQFDKYICFEPPFDIFMNAQECVSSCPYDVSQNPKECEEALDELYQLKEGDNFIAHIFYEKIHEIQGFFAYVNAETFQIYVMFWGYKPPTEEELDQFV